MPRPPMPTFEVLESKGRVKPITLRNHDNKAITIPPDFPVYYVASRQLGICGAIFLTRGAANNLIRAFTDCLARPLTRAARERTLASYRAGHACFGLCQDTFGPLERI